MWLYCPNNDVKVETQQSFFPIWRLFADGTEELLPRLNKFINKGGDYVEKYLL